MLVAFAPAWAAPPPSNSQNARRAANTEVLFMESAPWKISYRLTPLAAAALAVFIAVQAVAILNMRGVADPQGYALSTSKAIPLNTYEDDAQVTLMHALSYYGPTTNTFDVATNFGGPLLYGAKPVIWAAAKLGVVRHFEAQSLYVLYPADMLRIFKIFSFYKLAFLLLVPLGLYWLLKNHVSDRAGEIVIWLVAAMPFITGFELRLKPDGVVFGLTMCSMLYQLAFARGGRTRHLYAAATFMAVSFAMKFTMGPVIFPFLVCLWAGLTTTGRSPWRGEGLRLVLKTAGLGLGVFILSNPRIIPGAWIFYDFIRRYSTLNKKTAVSGDLWMTLGYRLTHFDVFLGKALGWLAIPAILAAIWQTLRGGWRPSATNCLLLLYVLQLFFLWFVANDHVLNTNTYYYYGQSMLTVALAALLIDWLWGLAADRSRVLSRGMAAVVVALAAATFSVNLDVLRFLCGQSTRQMAQAWVEEHIPAGASIGIALEPAGHLIFSDRYLLDPFRHRIVLLGRNGELTPQTRPDYVLWARATPLWPRFPGEGYEQIALFDAGHHLPREPYTSFQDDIYTLYRRTEAPLPDSAPGPTDADAALGAALAGEGERNFSLIEYHASGVFPLQMTAFLRADGRYLPLGPGQFFSALRAPSSPPAYLHQLPPTLLTLWGIKYAYARQDEAFAASALADPKLALTPVEIPEGVSLPAGLGLYRLGGYRGMAHFLPAAPAGEPLAIAPRWGGILARHKLLPYGRLYPAGAAPGPRRLLRVRMTVMCDGPMDLLLKGAGVPLSLYLGPGSTSIDVPLDVTGVTDPGYELNSAAPGAAGEVRSIETSPMAIREAVCHGADPYNAFATVEADVAGHVAFSLPWHQGWTAMVDGKDARVERGPGNTTLVPVGPGRHFVALAFTGSRN